MLKDLFQSALTMGKILLKSKINLPSYTAPEKSVVVIANGPSARSFIDKCTSVGIDNLKKQGLAFFAVNKFSCQPEFFSLKPKFSRIQLCILSHNTNPTSKRHSE